MRIEKCVLGAVGTNCYIVYHEEMQEALIIDPADNWERIKERLEAGGLTPKAILLTHGHFDHTMAVNGLVDCYHIPVYASKDEAGVLADPRYNLCGNFGLPFDEVKADHLLEDNELLRLAGFVIRVLFTPGHTSGGCCYYFEEEKVVFTGDTLFCGSVGRTDFPTGNVDVLVRSIREKLMTLPDEAAVYPGHDCETTIGRERSGNPYI